MKILLINKFLYPKGGDAISTLTTGNLLSKKGHEVHYWGMKHPDNPEYPYKDYFVTHVDYDESSGILTKLKAALNILYSFEAKNKLEALLEKIKPDVVHLNNFAHQISPSILHVLQKHKIPTVMTLRDYKLVCPTCAMLNKGNVCEKCKGGKYYWCFFNKCTKNSYIKSFLNTLEMYLHHKILHIYDKIDLVISTSQFMKQKHIEMGLRNQIICLPNFIDTQEWQPEYQSSEKAIVYFGRLTAKKGLFALLYAVKGLDIKLKIIGNGPIRQELEKKTITENINNVIFMGYKSGEELKKEIKCSIATVLPSEWPETFGRTIIESFALGKPVIGARIGGIPELVKDGKTGYTFEPRSIEDLRNTIKTILNNSQGRTALMGKRARSLVESNYNSDRYYQNLIKIYQMAITKRQSN